MLRGIAVAVGASERFFGQRLPIGIIEHGVRIALE
jgi:hypothetical protein